MFVGADVGVDQPREVEWVVKYVLAVKVLVVGVWVPTPARLSAWLGGLGGN